MRQHQESVTVDPGAVEQLGLLLVEGLAPCRVRFQAVSCQVELAQYLLLQLVGLLRGQPQELGVNARFGA
ncbi:hypothetical protein D3C77_549840 [compost metagenome]